MTALTLTDSKVVNIFGGEGGQLTVKGGEDIPTGRRGKFLRVDTTTGKAVYGNASSSGELANLNGVAMENQKYLGDSVTLLRWGLMDWGTALDGLSYGDKIYVSDTDGTFADAAGTVSKVAGYVYPSPDANGTVKKLAYIDLR